MIEMYPASDDDVCQKEREWRDALHSRLEGLQERLRHRDVEFMALCSNMEELKRDFIYNLKLLEERDGDLEKSEVGIENLKQLLLERDSVVSEMNIKISDLQQTIQELKKEKEDMVHSFDATVEKMTGEIQNLKRQLENHKAKKLQEMQLVELNHRHDTERLQRDFEICKVELRADHVQEVEQMKANLLRVTEDKERELKIKSKEIHSLEKELQCNKMEQTKLQSVIEEYQKNQQYNEEMKITYDQQMQYLQKLIREKDSSLSKLEVQNNDLHNRLLSLQGSLQQQANSLEDKLQKLIHSESPEENRKDEIQTDASQSLEFARLLVGMSKLKFDKLSHPVCNEQEENSNNLLRCIKHLKKSNQTLRVRSELQQNKFQALSHSYQRLKVELSTCQETLRKTSAESGARNERIQVLQNDISKLEKEYSAISNQTLVLKNVIKDMRRSAEDMYVKQNEGDNGQDDAGNKMSVSSASCKSCSELNSTYESMKMENDKLQDVIHELRDKIVSLEAVQKNLQGTENIETRINHLESIARKLKENMLTKLLDRSKNESSVISPADVQLLCFVQKLEQAVVKLTEKSQETQNLQDHLQKLKTDVDGIKEAQASASEVKSAHNCHSIAATCKAHHSCIDSKTHHSQSVQVNLDCARRTIPTRKEVNEHKQKSNKENICEVEQLPDKHDPLCITPDVKSVVLQKRGILNAHNIRRKNSTGFRMYLLQKSQNMANCKSNLVTKHC